MAGDALAGVWEKTLDQGATWSPVVTAGKILTLAVEEFAAIGTEYSPGLRAVITHEDPAGFTEKLTTAPRYHQHQPAHGALTLRAPALTPHSRVTLAGTLSAAPGIKFLTYEWATAPDLLFTLPNRHPGNEAYFNITPAALTTDRALRVIVRVTDHFNQTTELRPPPLAIAQPPAWRVAFASPDRPLTRRQPGNRINDAVV